MNSLNTNTYQDSQALHQQAWHFAMFSDIQLEKLKEGFNELSLLEYDEDWRTNLVKEIGEGDIIMLYKRGEGGYVGAFKALGWRIFYFKEDREEIQLFGKDKQEVTGEANLSDIAKYDIYNGKTDGASICANIIVEPIAFIPEGIGNPGSIYRRTIAKYDPHYAWILMEKFKQNEVL